MLVATSEQMSEIDRMSIEEIGIPGVVLMENAALQVVSHVADYLDKTGGSRVVVVCGKGNNGGDGFAAARHLHNMGVDVCVFLLSSFESIYKDARINLHILHKMGVPVKEISEKNFEEQLKQKLDRVDVVVDAIFGTGLAGIVKDEALKVIDMINRSCKYVLAVDIPSGVNGTTGHICGACVMADMTVTFGLVKTGLLVHPGSEAAGELIVADIGFPVSVLKKAGINIYTIEKDYVEGIFPVRALNSSKGSYGKIALITGSTGMTGSGCLCSNAALRTGAGLIYTCVPASLIPIYGAVLTEPILVPLEDGGRGELSEDCIGKLKSCLAGMDAAAIGPGLALGEDIGKILSAVINSVNFPVVLDADALNALSGNKEMFGMLKSNAVLTPHPGEMARLTGLSIEDIQRDRINVAREFAVKRQVVIVLKGFRTVVASPDGTVYINITGNPGMATAGSGDVLAGIILSFLGQGLTPIEAALAGVYIHGFAGDIAAGKKGEHGMCAGDIVSCLPDAVNSVYN